MPESDGTQPDAPDVRQLAERLQQLLLGGRRRFTPVEVSERAGVDREYARQLWRSLGFASVDDEDVVFTDSDVEALETVQRIRAAGFDDAALRAGMARFVGQTFARLASWEGQLLLNLVADRPELLSAEGNVLELVERLLPELEQLQRYVWRRQLAAYLDRVVSQADGAPSGHPSVAVGFADLAGYTSLTRRVEEAALREVLDAFEQVATEKVGARRGRIVKTIGDEVLFTADDAAAGAEIALDLLDAAERDEHIPALRVGLACGPVIDRLGDVYGATVNIAARLTSLGKPGNALVDRETAEALEGDPRFRLKALRAESVRGYGHLRPWRLRRARPG
jgi:adenylate cyclase